MKLCVNLVTWNGAKYVQRLFGSLRQQSFKDWELLILDNNSQDDTLNLLTKELNNFSVHYKLIEKKENTGFASGHNSLFQISQSEYVLVLNQDIYLEPDCLEKMVAFMEAHPNAAAVAPRLMRWKVIEGSLVTSDEVDSLGLKIWRNRRVTEIGVGESWCETNITAQQGEAVEVFGVSGACVMLRKSMVWTAGGLFDENFKNYKEDVDLAYRLRSSGYSAHVWLDTAAYHARSGAGQQDASDLAAVKNKNKQSALVRYSSYKNHLATLYKNEYWQNFLLDLPWIFWYEFKKFTYFLLFDRPVLIGLQELWKDMKGLRLRRKKIVDLRLIGWKEIRGWWKL